MTKQFLLVISFFLLLGVKGYAQVFLNTEYIGTSNFRDENNVKTGGKGDARIISGGFKIPLSTKIDENGRPMAWAVGVGASYAKLVNKNLSEDICLSEILNTQVGLYHFRPLSTKWSMLAIAGIGIYTDSRSLSNIRFKHLLGQGGVVFIRHLKSNLDIGGGLALNNAFGYPMVFPAIYFNWGIAGRYSLRISMVEAVNITAGMNITENFDLNWVADMNAMLALVEKDGEDMIFTHQYITTGIQPNIKLGNSFSIPITVGISGYRPAFFQKRTLKDFFKDTEYDPYFSISPYVSLGLKYGF